MRGWSSTTTFSDTCCCTFSCFPKNFLLGIVVTARVSYLFLRFLSDASLVRHLSRLSFSFLGCCTFGNRFSLCSIWWKIVLTLADHHLDCAVLLLINGLENLVLSYVQPTDFRSLSDHTFLYMKFVWTDCFSKDHHTTFW